MFLAMITIFGLDIGPASAMRPHRTSSRYAVRQIGKNYRWGADGPRSFDCSGLTLAAWRAAGRRLPHNAARQARATARVHRHGWRLRPGDLVFYHRPISHVAIYIGRRHGRRMVVEAANRRLGVVKRPIGWAGHPVRLGRVR